jgi:type III secretion system YscI/HrpB-like protein
MIDAIVSGSINTLAQASPSALTAPAVVSDAERFRSLMQADPAAPGGAPAAAAAPSASDLGQPLAVGKGPESPTIGQTIVGAMQDLSADTRARFAKAEEVLSKPDLTMSDLLTLQFTLLQTSVQFEIASKGISKMAQNVDSVLKTQ